MADQIITEQAQILICHRPEDKRIADTIRNHLDDWGHRVIFQSSDARHGPRIVEPFDETLGNVLRNVKLILFVYTFEHEDWSRCMWECGVSTNSKPEDIRIIIFQCTDDSPSLFENQRRILIQREDILRFTRAAPFRQNADERLIRTRSDRLYNDLHLTLPERREERYRWDFITLELTAEIIRDIKQEGNPNVAIDIIKRSCFISKTFGESIRHFGFQTLQKEGDIFQTYVDRWKVLANNEFSKEWVNDVYQEIFRAIEDKPSVPTWNFLKSMRPRTEWWFYPVVNHVRVKSDGGMQFELYLYQVPGPIPNHP